MDFPTRGRWSDRKYTLLYLFRQYKVECLIIDDAHDLSLQHLIFLKEITDQLRLPPLITRWDYVWSQQDGAIPCL